MTTTLSPDLKQSIRRLTRSPLYAVIAIVILALGVGSTAAMSAVVDGLLFRAPVGVSEPDAVVRVRFHFGTAPVPGAMDEAPYRSYRVLRDAGVFERVAAFASAQVSLGAGIEAELVNAQLVSAAFFDVLRPHAAAGHMGGGATAIAEGGDRIVISHALWQRRFGGDRQAIGAPLVVDGRTYVVSGVTAAGFQPMNSRSLDLWLPLEHGEIAQLFAPGWRNNRRTTVGVVARLAAGVSPAAAEARASALLQGAAQADEDEDPTGAVLTSIVPGRGTGGSRESTVALWMAGLSILVLLIASANLANTVLARTLGQRREYFIRTALGASRAALVRRALMDSLLVIVPGALGALAVSYLLRNLAAGFLPGDLPIAREIWDARSAAVIPAGVAISIGFITIAALLPIRRFARDRGVTTEISASASLGKRSRQSLLAVQAGLCLTLILTAALFASSLRRVAGLDLGVALEHTLQVTLNLPTSENTPDAARSVYDEALDAFKTVDGVESVALAERSPILAGTGTGPRRGAPDGAPGSIGSGIIAYRSEVGAGFFSTVAQQGFRGRDFSPIDRRGTEPVAVINEPLARRLWGDLDPLGDCMWLDGEPGCHRVIGVIGGAWKFSILRRQEMAVYTSLTQSDKAAGILYLRVKGSARAFVPRARAVAQSLRPDMRAARVVVLADLASRELRPWQLATTIFGAFAGMASLIAAIGIYGIVAMGVQLKTREIGVRLALGAGRSHVLRVVLGEAIAALIAGVGVGTASVVMASRWLNTLLYDITPADPVVLVQAASALALLTVLGAAVPAVKALQLDPLATLRSD